MTRRPLLWLAAVGALFAVALPGANAQLNAASPDQVTNWNRIATSTLVLLPAPASGAPVALQINMAMTQGAVYDAVNAMTPKHHRPYLLARRFSARGSDEARDRSVSRLVQHHLDGARGHLVPEQGQLVAVARHAVRHVALGHT
jgi:hypothetical protein